MPPTLTTAYAGYGDTLLLQYQSSSNEPQYWLIDGGPVTNKPRSGTTVDGKPKHAYNSFYQYLRQSLLRFCCSGKKDSNGVVCIDRLAGIIVTHPDKDHMDGVIQLLTDWLPDKGASPSVEKPLSFKGPVVLNDLFFDPKSAAHRALSKLLTAKGFDKLAVDDPVAPIPNGMVNRSQPGYPLWKMAVAPPKPSYYAALTVDDSPTNASSIITMWNGGATPSAPIITTGDSIGQNALDFLEDLRDEKTKALPTLGIFKVPHHGSQRNSQIDESYDITTSESMKEKDHQLFLALIAWYLDTRVPDGPDRALIRSINNDTTDKYADAWVARDPPNRSLVSFGDIIGRVADAFHDFIVFSDFDYGEGHDLLHLRNDADLTRFAVLLAHRHIDILASIYANKPDLARERRQVDYLTTKTLNPNFILKEFTNPGQNAFPYLKQSLKRPSESSRKTEPTDEDMVTCLYQDPGATVQYQMGAFTFYGKFRANNYIISANGEYKHPSPSVVAAIMAAAIVQGPPPSDRYRLFVTDGASIKVNTVRAIVTDLLSGKLGANAPKLDKWKEIIGVFYLDTDYCAVVPVDRSTKVVGSAEIPFDASVDTVDARNELHAEFMRVASYDIPRAAEPPSTPFLISLVEGKSLKSLTYDASAKAFKVGDPKPSAFRLERINTSVAAVDGALNRAAYQLWAMTPTTTTLVSADVVFLLVGQPSTKDGANFHMLDSKQTVIFSYDSGLFSFKPKTSATPALLRFKRRDPIGSSSAPVFMSAPVRAVEGNLPSGIALSEPESESLESWWKHAGSQKPPASVTLADVVKAALGERHSEAALKAIPAAPFALASAPSLVVDMENSPPVVKDPKGPPSIDCALIMSSPIIFKDVGGLGPMTVDTLSAIMSPKTATLALEVTFSGAVTETSRFEFRGLSAVESYLRAIDYAGSIDTLSLAALGTTILGEDTLMAFLSLLPRSICSAISLPTWPVDVTTSKIAFSDTPFGIDVSSATIAALPLTKIATIGGFDFSLNGASLNITSKSDGTFDIVLEFDVVLPVDAVKLALQLTVSRNPLGLVVLDFRTSPASTLLEPTDSMMSILHLRNPCHHVRRVLGSFSSVFPPSSPD
ncbi:hypothetical protein BOTBODRAFT_529373 [Botryobasidium botryosum FD-172 SS1]|uniref:Uncharacterized protein n=1 Tax=Botryobasidium botryosum (strain FD-172 SS1) TaxID=930990 RepID=A0A067MBX2_BOTB1|nr:hypothetical protein BOTBODRAFT_529373 [Botryobasidium botryosum FD-172 SS1]